MLINICKSATRGNKFFILATWTIVIFDVVYSTSINYGIPQQPITDINQLMPKLCQNQTMICEGSFCIPGIKKCVCDLRNPVQFGRYCLHQVDIGVQCFATSQCNHTVKGAVCSDGTSEIISDERAKSKLDQWQQLNDLRQQSNLATSTIINQRPSSSQNRYSSVSEQQLTTNNSETNIPASNLRNSPYEIGYMDPYKQFYMNNETTQANLPKKYKIDEENRKTTDDLTSTTPRSDSSTTSTKTEIQSSTSPTSTSTLIPATLTKLMEVSDYDREKFLQTTKNSNYDTTTRQHSTNENATAKSRPSDSEIPRPINPTTQPTNQPTQSVPKRLRTSKWPPGRCSCPVGYIFDQMVRKCLPLSLVDAKCKSDDDCRHIIRTHCSPSTSKCQCDEPLSWNQQELSCVKTKDILEVKSRESDVTWKGDPQAPKIVANFTITIVILSLCIIFGTLSILILTVKCFSTKTSSTLITASDRDKRKRRANKQSKSKQKQTQCPKNHQVSSNTRPSAQLSNITKATRGRILNYDFETETPPTPPSPANGTLPHRPSRQSRQSTSSMGSGTTVKSLNDVDLDCENSIGSGPNKSEDPENPSAMLPPSPLPNQPHYMMTSALKGASAPSAIAAAAAAAARKRKERQSGLHNDTIATNNRPHDPVFL